MNSMPNLQTSGRVLGSKSGNPFRVEKTPNSGLPPQAQLLRRPSVPYNTAVVGTEPQVPPRPLKEALSSEQNLIDLNTDVPSRNSRRDPEHFPTPLIKTPTISNNALSPTGIAILLMGGTGAGKSSFIAKVTEAPVKVGNSLRPCTTTCSDFSYTFAPNHAITLIDTPGFDDLERPDMEVLSSIVTYLDSSPHLRIVGIIYMHRITDKRVTATSRMNLRMLQALCGEHFYQNIILTTTMWDTAPSGLLADLEHREAELNASNAFWAGMLEKGSGYARHLGTAVSGKAIVDVCMSKYNPPALNIALEMKNGNSLEDTSVGRILTAELRKREEKKRREMIEEAEEEEEEKDALLAQKMEKEAQLRIMEERVRLGTQGLAKSSRRTDEDGSLGPDQDVYTHGRDRHQRHVPKQHERYTLRKEKKRGSLGSFFSR